MSLINIFEVPKTRDQLHSWSFAHADHHVSINAGIMKTYGKSLPIYILDPFDPFNPQAFEAWLYNHQEMHQNQDQILGINGFDLTGVNWQDVQSLATWIQSHAQEHYQASGILKIG